MDSTPPPHPGLLRSIARDKVAIVLLLLAFAVRSAVWVEFFVHDLDLSHCPPLDMANFVENGRRIAAGDVLMMDQSYGILSYFREEYYGPERFDRLFGPLTYVGAPLYAYVVGACFALSGTDSPYVVTALQVLLGTATCAFAYGLAERRLGRTTARIALFLLAFALEPSVYGAFVLRETLTPFVGAWALHDLARAEDEGGTTWGRAGLAWGVAWLARTSVVLLLPAIGLVLLGCVAREAPTRRRALEPVARAAFAFLLGVTVALVPLMARNTALGVPPLRFCVGRQASIVMGLHPAYPGVGGFHRPALARELIDRHRADTPLQVLAATVAEHGSLASWLRLFARKAHGLASPYDLPCSVRLDVLGPALASTWALPVRWGLLVPLAAVGLLVVVARGWRTNVVLLGGTAWGVGTLLLSNIVTRYELDVYPVIAILAATAVVRAGEHARARRASRVAILVLGAIAVAVVGRAVPKRPRPETKASASHYVRLAYPGERRRAPREYLLARLADSSLP